MADERTARPKLPGRSLDPVSNAGPRGMIVPPKLAQAGGRRTEFGLRPAAALFTFHFSVSLSLSLSINRHVFISRHRRRRLHRIPPCRRAHPPRRARPRRRQPDHRPSQEPRASAWRRVPRRRSRRPRGRAARAVQGMDYVLHQAAIPSVPRSVEDPITSNRANVDATLNMLVAARDAGVKRVVYAGSSSAYGNTPTLPKREDMPTNPLSPYALQKLVGEQYMQMFTRSTASRRSRSATSTCSGRGRIRLRRTPASSRSSRRRCSRTRRRRFTATASRRATSPTWRTSWTACCAR